MAEALMRIAEVLSFIIIMGVLIVGEYRDHKEKKLYYKKLKEGEENI